MKRNYSDLKSCVHPLSCEEGWSDCLVETKTSLEDHLVFLTLQLVTMQL